MTPADHATVDVIRARLASNGDWNTNDWRDAARILLDALIGAAVTADKLAHIEARAKHPAAYGLLDLEADDVLALVNIAKAARALQETEWWAFIGWEPSGDRQQAIDSSQEALAAALAVLDADQ